MQAILDMTWRPVAFSLRSWELMTGIPLAHHPLFWAYDPGPRCFCEALDAESEVA